MKFRKSFPKFMVPMALFKKFLNSQSIASVEVSNMAICSSKTKEFRDTDSIGCRAKNGKLTISKSKSSGLSYFLVEEYH